MDSALLDIEDQILDKLIGKFISVVKEIRGWNWSQMWPRA
jgi:hypothetical protein